jgi:hypothetical protein
MRRYTALGLVIALGIIVTGGLVYAAGTPSAKATAQVGTIAILNTTEMDWTTIMSNTIKTPNQKDLFIDVSLECGLYTDTKVKGKGGDPLVAEAMSAVMAQVLIDGQEAYPGAVNFCRRSQELKAVFGGVFESCYDENGDGIIEYWECEFSDEELELVLDTMNANAFNFIQDDLGPGDHVIEVQAMISSTVGYEDPNFADAHASIGKGSVTVEEVRMIQNEDIILP